METKVQITALFPDHLASSEMHASVYFFFVAEALLHAVPFRPLATCPFLQLQYVNHIELFLIGQHTIDGHWAPLDSFRPSEDEEANTGDVRAKCISGVPQDDCQLWLTLLYCNVKWVTSERLPFFYMCVCKWCCRCAKLGAVKLSTGSCLFRMKNSMWHINFDLISFEIPVCCRPCFASLLSLHGLTTGPASMMPPTYKY